MSRVIDNQITLRYNFYRAGSIITQYKVLMITLFNVNNPSFIIFLFRFLSLPLQSAFSFCLTA